MKRLPLVLIILDGWGVAPAGPGNAIALARPRHYVELWKRFPHALLRASGAAVGLPARQYGNSEAGHMNLGAGRVVAQDAVRINHAIDDGQFFKNPGFIEGIRHLEKTDGRLHLLGLLTGTESGHAYPRHLEALLKLSRMQRVAHTYVHLFTDGRDTPKFAALDMLKKLERHLSAGQRIATIMGRFWMDRAKRWSRTEAVYNTLLLGTRQQAPDAETAVLNAYNRDESDEFIKPTILGSTPAQRRESRIRDGDTVIFFNLRSDRARQITKAFVQRQFEKMNQGAFRRKRVCKRLRFVALTEFGPDLDHVITAFPGITLPDTLPMQLRQFRQLYIAESEKFAHVTYFFNGGYPRPVAGETRTMIPSENVASFDEQPAMATPAIGRAVLAAITAKRYDCIVANFANADMVGHTGNLKAGIAAVRSIDEQLGLLATAVLHRHGTLLITGDHGNIETMLHPKTSIVDTEHSNAPVPFLIVRDELRKKTLRSPGTLADVAPTILTLLGLPVPKAMTGHSLLRP